MHLKKLFFALEIPTVFCTSSICASLTLTPSTITQITNSDNVWSFPVTTPTNNGAILVYPADPNKIYNFTYDGSTWSGPTQIANAGYHSTHAAWVAGSGNDYVTIWINRTSSSAGPITHSSSSNEGVSWSSPSSFGGSFASVSAPSVIAGTSNQLVIGGNSGGYAFSSTSTDNGASWSGLSFINGLSDNTVSIIMMSSVGDNAFMASWVDNENNAWSAYSTDGSSWTNVSAITTSGTVASTVWTCGNALGFLASWQDTNGDAYVSFSEDNGVSWNAPIKIASNLYNNGSSTSAISLAGLDSTFVAAWIGSDQNLYASLTGNLSTWTSPIRITTGGNLSTSLPLQTDISIQSIFASACPLANGECLFAWLQTDQNTYATTAAITTVLANVTIPTYPPYSSTSLANATSFNINQSQELAINANIIPFQKMIFQYDFSNLDYNTSATVNCSINVPLTNPQWTTLITENLTNAVLQGSIPLGNYSVTCTPQGSSSPYVLQSILPVANTGITDIAFPASYWVIH
jgi:hypothetical protein